MSIHRCVTCMSYSLDLDDNVVSWKCGSCTVRSVEQIRHEEQQQLGGYTKARSKAARKVMGWTQEVLAFKLAKKGVTKSHISQHEAKSSDALCHPAVAEWIDKVEQGK